MGSETVLLTGASGLLGTWLRRHTPADTEVVSVVHRRGLPFGPTVRCDLRDRDAVSAALAGVEPDLVIHAGYARDEASIVAATRNIVDGARLIGAELVFVSSEAVFSGDGRPRDESDRPDPVWDYGRWKAEAEAHVEESSANSTIVRPPLLLSLNPEDHVVASIRAGTETGEPTTWFVDEKRQPAHAEEVAAAIWDITAIPAGERDGVWHLPGPELLSRYEIAERVVSVLGLDHTLITPATTPADAHRPRDINLRDTRARRQLGWSPTPVLSNR